MRIRALLMSGVAVVGMTACRAEETKDGSAPKPSERPVDVPAEKPIVKPAATRAAATEARVLSKDGTEIAFETQGHGPVLVVVSGALSHRGMLRDNPLAAQLAQHFTVCTYDRRGRGASTNVKPYAVDREIEDLEALIAHAGRPAYLFGVSSGAALAMQAAAKLGPAVVTRLALYEPPYGQDPAAFAKQKEGVAKRVETGQPGEAAEFFLTEIGTPRKALEDMKRSPAWDAIKKMDFTLSYDFAVLGDGRVPEDVTRAISVPTLVMTGDKTMPYMAPTADQIAKQIRGAQRKTLAGQTHQVQADAIVPVLVAFFTS